MMNHQFIVITSLPFVHTARRSYRLSAQVNSMDCISVRSPNVEARNSVNLIA